MKTALKLIFSLTGLLSLLAIAASVVFWVVAVRVNMLAFMIAWRLIALLFCVIAINYEDSADYKLTWCALIIAIPLFFGCLYLITKAKKPSKALRQNTVLNSDYPLASYLENSINAQSFEGEALYYNSASQFFDAALCEIQNAKHSIYIEFFSMRAGYLLRRIINALRQKAEQNVRVSLLCDGVGCMGKLSRRLIKIIQSYNIDIRIYNEPKSTLCINKRTHRKIICIDKRKAFVCGMNIGDKYINLIHPYGIWRDCGIQFGGSAAEKLALEAEKLFLQTRVRQKNKSASVDNRLPCPNIISETSKAENATEQTKNSNLKQASYIIPFCDDPQHSLRISKSVFMCMLHEAKKTIFLGTPYLLLDNQLLQLLIIKAKSGVDTTIVVPHTPDKKAIFVMTRSFYPALIEAGVKIFEYTKGFWHSKIIVCDKNAAYVGSCNLNHRSLYFQHECGAVLLGEKQVEPIAADFENTLIDCNQVSLEKAKGTPLVRLFRSLMRFFSPLC